jgi:hypothetical protein
MKRKGFSYAQLWLLSVFLLSSMHTNAQDRHLDTLYLNQPAFTSSNDVLSITGEGSFTKSNSKTGIIDDVMLYPDWHQGFVNFKNGEQLSNVELKFNLLKNELYFNNNNKLNLFADTVTSFTIFDTSSNRVAVARFSNGYPHLGQRGDKTFYLVLTSGPQVHLLKYISKKKQDVYEYSGPSKTVYSFTQELLVYDVKNNSLKAIKNNLASIQKALPQYTAVIQQSLKDKDSKHLSDEEIMQVIKQINDSQH